MFVKLYVNACVFEKVIIARSVQETEEGGNWHTCSSLEFLFVFKLMYFGLGHETKICTNMDWSSITR